MTYVKSTFKFLLIIAMSLQNTMKITSIIVALVLLTHTSHAQDADALVKKVKARLAQVNDYVATGKMKTDIAFIKAPAGNVKVLFKKPNNFKLKKENGISILPKGGVAVNMSSILAGDDYSVLSAGQSTIQGKPVKVVKLLPNNENSDVVLTTLYIDEANALIRKSTTTTRESGTFEMEMSYGKYASYALPEKVIFLFNTKDYKLPKGVTLEFETGETPKPDAKNKKGKVEIVYSSYIINKGIADAEFK